MNKDFLKAGHLPTLSMAFLYVVARVQRFGREIGLMTGGIGGLEPWPVARELVGCFRPGPHTR